jgi:dTDP-glucose 4,6-dehydratase
MGPILAQTHGLWEELRGRRLFLTGGTGFFGCWLLESFLHANEELNLEASVMVLTRSVESFRRKAPHLVGHRAVAFHIGDVRTFDFPPGEFSHIIHAATEASAKLNDGDPLRMLDTIVQGTQRVLDFARHCGTHKLLLTSSGAVFGRQPPGLSHLPESHNGAPDPCDPRAAYAEGKRLAELLVTLYARQHGIETKIARAFAFLGPYLPLDTHFAAGNMLRDALAGGPLRVNGDGTPYRSYLYAADLAAWLWTILCRGTPGRSYNVGSEQAVSIAELAAITASLFRPQPSVVVARRPVPSVPAERYVPDCRRAREELGLRQTIDLAEALRRTALWHGAVADGSHLGVPRRLSA